MNAPLDPPPPLPASLPPIAAPGVGGPPPKAGALTPGTPLNPRQRHLLTLAALFLVALAVYVPSLKNGFIWDDDQYVTQNLELRRSEGLTNIWFEPRSIPDYYPLTFTSFWLEYRIWEANPAGYHAVNALLHALNAVLAYLVLRRLKVPGAAVAAALFAVHPVQVESVAWVSERKNVLAGAMALLSVLAFLRFTGVGDDVAAATAAPEEPAPPGRGATPDTVGSASAAAAVPAASASPVEPPPAPPGERWGLYAGALILFVLAMLAKTVVVMLPVVLALLLWWKRESAAMPRFLASRSAPALRSASGEGGARWQPAGYALLLPFVAAGLPLGWLAVKFQREMVGTAGAAWDYGFAQRVLVAGRAFWFYLGKLVWPQRLSFFYARWEPDPAQLWPWLLPLAVVALLAGLWASRKRIGRGPLVGVLAFLALLFPGLGFFNIYWQKFSWVADHVQYHACLAVIAVAVGVLTLALRHAASGSAGLGAAVGAIAVLGLAVNSVVQQRVYQNEETLWVDVLEKNPDSSIAHGNLGAIRLEQGDLQQAFSHFGQAMRLDPSDANPLVNRGDLLMLADRPGEALAEYARALQLRPAYGEIISRMGRALALLGREAEATEAFADAAGRYRHAVASRPDDPELHLGYGRALIGLGQPDEAGREFEAAFRLRPNDPEVLTEVGLFLCTRGRPDQGGPLLQRMAELTAAKVTPVDRAIRLAWLTATYPDARLRNARTSLELAKQAVEATDRRSARALDALAAAQAESGSFEDAVATAQEALALARAAGLAPRVPGIEARVALYQSRQPFRQPLPGVGPGGTQPAQPLGADKRPDTAPATLPAAVPATVPAVTPDE